MAAGIVGAYIMAQKAGAAFPGFHVRVRRDFQLFSNGFFDTFLREAAVHMDPQPCKARVFMAGDHFHTIFFRNGNKGRGEPVLVRVGNPGHFGEIPVDFAVQIDKTDNDRFRAPFHCRGHMVKGPEVKVKIIFPG